MNLFDHKLLLGGVGLLAVSAAVSFTVVALLGGPDGSVEADNTGACEARGEGTWNCNTVEGAEELVGYPLAFPEYLPEGYVPSEYIHVNEFPFPGQPRASERFWHNPDLQGLTLLTLTQSTFAFGLGGGEPTEVNGLPGQRRVTEAHPPDRPHDMLSLYWREGEYSYQLSGFLNGPMDEETLRKIAASVRLP